MNSNWPWRHVIATMAGESLEHYIAVEVDAAACWVEAELVLTFKCRGQHQGVRRNNSGVNHIAVFIQQLQRKTIAGSGEGQGVVLDAHFGNQYWASLGRIATFLWVSIPHFQTNRCRSSAYL